jgi:hypothetical protein
MSAWKKAKMPACLLMKNSYYTKCIFGVYRVLETAVELDPGSSLTAAVTGEYPRGGETHDDENCNY